jgi:hypothetical protein
LRTYETVVNLIGNTTNRGGLVVRARLDRRKYATGKKVTAQEFRAINIERDDFHGDWNYVIHPRNKAGWPADLFMSGPLQEDHGSSLESLSLGDDLADLQTLDPEARDRACRPRA